MLFNINGQIVTAEEAKVRVMDRGFLYGDSLYEVVRTYSGKFLLLDEHLERLASSAGLCHMTLGQSLEEYRSEIGKTFAAFRRLPGQSETEVYMRIIVTRGAGKIGFGLPCVQTPTQYVILIQPVETPTPAQYKNGFKVQVSRRIRNDRRALDPAMKSGNYLNSLLAYLEASASEFDDALLCDSNGHVTEGTTFNLFYIRRGIVATPPLDIGILDGITRRHVLQAAQNLGLETREVRFPKERLYEADEVFLTSSLKEVFPITRVDGVTIGKGVQGNLTAKIHRAYRQNVGLEEK